MKQYIVTISNEEEKALMAVMVDIQEWVQNAISNRARQAMDDIIIEQTDKNPKKLQKVVKEQIIAGLTVKTAIEKKAEFDELFNNTQIGN